jgi:hypothetical protein
MRNLFRNIFWFSCLFVSCGLCSSGLARFKHGGIEKYERLALQSNKAGTEFRLDLAGIGGCNKSRVKYLGSVRTKKGAYYKILTSFHVFRTSPDMCRGASSIKIYDAGNRFLGAYHVGMPDDLPDTLITNKLCYYKPQAECPLRKGTSINLLNGLPNHFFVPCGANGGEVYFFSN